MSEWKTYKPGEIENINPRVPLKQGNEYSFINALPGLPAKPVGSESRQWNFDSNFSTAWQHQ